MPLFDLCTRAELEVLIQGLKCIDIAHVDDKHKESIGLCLGTLEWNLNDRYTRWES